MVNITNQEYQKLVDSKAKKSPMGKNLVWAFVVGGLICVLGQAIMNLFLYFKLDQLNAGTATSITLIFLSALFTGLKLYDNLAKYAGAGTLVPITGFANAVVSPALEFKSEGMVMGLSAKMFVIAGPVLVFGIGASIIYGLILRLLF
ncbi:MAG: stage V sporulation protein AC [Oscillospiraceae bacterium]|nr:stage V sporulation protein AC [Oscillospiraceae bacterium]